MALSAANVEPQTSDAAENSTPNGGEKLKQSNHEEYQYLHLIRDILDFGEHRPDRCVQV